MLDKNLVENFPSDIWEVIGLFLATNDRKNFKNISKLFNQLFYEKISETMLCKLSAEWRVNQLKQINFANRLRAFTDSIQAAEEKVNKLVLKDAKFKSVIKIKNLCGINITN